VLSDLAALNAHLEHFDGGDPARDLFVPRRFRGQQLTGVLLGAPVLPGLIDPNQMSNLFLPQGVSCSEVFSTHAFGRLLQLLLPPATRGGHMLQMALTDGVLSAAVYEATPAGTFQVVGAAAIRDADQ